MIKSAFTWEAIYILLLFIQMYDKVASANKIIMTQEANLFGTITFTMLRNNIYILCMSTPARSGYAVGNPLGATFILTVIVTGVEKGATVTSKLTV